jgi:hypothetical protein
MAVEELSVDKITSNEMSLDNMTAGRVTRLGEISPFGQFFMAKFFLEKIAQ